MVALHPPSILVRYLFKTQINDLSLYLKESEKEQTKPKTGRRKKIIKIKAEIKEIEKFSETKS